jgi:molecular chaperone DnaK
MIRELRDAINRNDIPKVKMLFDDLQKESMKIGEYLYKSATGGETSNQ